MTVSLSFITDDGDGWRQHEDNEANCHVHAGERRNDSKCYRHGSPAQQPYVEEVETSSKGVIENVDQPKKDADRNGDAEHSCKGADIGFVFDEIRCDMKSGAGRYDRGNDYHLAVTPNERPLAVGVEY